jgi:hypothetical protein
MTPVMPGWNSMNWKPRPISNCNGAWTLRGGRDFAGSFMAGIYLVVDTGADQEFSLRWF